MERKKISLEIQWAVGPKTGVGWYIFNIVKGLVQNNKNDYTGEFINFMNRHNVKEQINYDIKIKQNKFISYSAGNFATFGNINLSGINGIAPIFKINI